MRRIYSSIIVTTVGLMLAACSSGPKDGDYVIQLLTTNDVHGTYFDSPTSGTG